MSLLAALRAQTRAEHEAIEAVVPLMDPALTRSTYSRYLQATLGFYRPLEARLAPWREALPDADRRFHTPALERDLASLDATVAVPECQEIPSVRDEFEALGCLYVLEGSTLGGRLLLRHVSATLHLDAAHGASFLAGAGPETGALWKRFCAHAETRGALASERTPSAVEAARQTFVSLRAWLELLLRAG